MAPFKKSSSGPNYEVNMLALMALKLFNNDCSKDPLITKQRNFDDFEIGFNLKDMGLFGNLLVIILKKNNRIIETIAIRLSHLGYRRKLTIDLLSSDKGNYSLLKNAESTEKFIDRCDRFILFSNIKFSAYEDKMEEFQIKKDYEHGAISFLPVVAANESKFKNKLFQSFEKKENDLMEKNLRIRTSKIKKSKINTSDEKEKQCRELRSLHETELSRRQSERDSKKCELFDKFFKKFSLIPNQVNNEGVQLMIQEIFERTYSSSNSSREYVRLISDWYNTKIINSNEPRLNTFRIGKLLIICLLGPFLVNVQPQTDEHKKQWTALKTVAGHFLVTEIGADFVKKWTEKMNNALWDNTEPIIVQIDEDVNHSRQVLEAVEIMKRIDLNKKLIIIGRLECGDETEFIDLEGKLVEVFKGFGLSEATFRDLRVINKLDQKLEDVPEYYFFRSIQVPCFTFNEIGGILKENFVVLNTHREPDSFKTEMKEGRIFTMEEFLSGTGSEPALLLIKTENYNKVLQLFREKCPNENVYFFKHHSTKKGDAKFDLISSHGPSVQLLTNRKTKSINDEDFSAEGLGRVNILCAEPGMGKTSSMKFLHNQFVARNYWSKLVSLKDHFKFFKDYKNETVESILEYFLTTRTVTLESLHIQCYLIRNRVCLFFDGLDELDSKYLDNAINCIQKVLGSPQIHKVFISARKHLKEYLEREFNVNIIEMGGIGKDEQMVYIRKRLSPIYSNSEIEKIIETIYNNFGYIQKNYKLLGIPLQLYIITEVLICQPRQPVEELLILSELFAKFLNLKLERFQAKSLKKFDNLLEKHEIFALKICLDANHFSQLISPETYQETIEQLSNENNIDGILFEHQIFPEYLCASYLIKNQKQITNFREFIFNSRYDTIRYFIDMKLAEKSPLHLAVIYQQHELILNEDMDKIRGARDQAKRNVLQLSICYFRQDYPELKRLEVEKEDAFEEPKTVAPESESKLFKHLSKLCITEEQDELFGWSSAEYAIKFNNLTAIDCLLNSDERNRAILEDYCIRNEASILGYSSINGFNNLLLDGCSIESIERNLYCFHYCYQKNYFIKAIHLVAKYGQIGVLKKLIALNQLGIIKCKGEDGCTALHYAAEYGHEGFLKELLNHPGLLSDEDVNYNCKDDDVYTALRHAAENGHVGCLKVLISSPKCDVSCENKKVCTALCSAAERGHVDCLKLLMDNSKCVEKCERKIGNTALHAAAENGHFGCVKVLIEESECDVNWQDEYGRTALHCAAERENFECLMELVKLGNLEINLENNENYTAVHCAIEKGNLECLRALIEHPKFDIKRKNINAVLDFARRHEKDECVKLLKKYKTKSNFKCVVL